MIKDRSWVEINLDNFRHNLSELKKVMLPKQDFLQIVKADAYGHGAYEIAKTAIELGAVYLGVANPEEGKLLRMQGIKAPILILSPALIEEIPLIFENDLVPTLSELEFAEALSKQSVIMNRTQNIHVKVDTGMHRSGFRIEDFSKAYKVINKLPNLIIEGIYSHYAASENDDEFTELQMHQFNSVLDKIKPLPKYIHLANSSALISHNSWKANLVRLGIMSYGIYTNSKQYNYLNLKSVMTFKSTIAQIKKLCIDDYIGYNKTWQATQDGLYGIIPIGYADGYDFLLSNKGAVAVNGQICRVIGRVSMDMITVDMSSIPRPDIGNEVILMGGGSNMLRAEQLASKYNGSAYELLCQVGRRAKRYYYSEGKLVSHTPMSRRDFVPTDYDNGKLGTIITSAINQRLQDEEIADLIYKEVLKGFFFNKDKDIQYRRNFVHSIEFIDSDTNSPYYIAKTKLSFTKQLQNDYFIVACANRDDVLKRYFQRKDVEYRWLMDTNFTVKSNQFKIVKVKINKLKLETISSIKNQCLEIKCTHSKLSSLIGQDVSFSIETETLYPKSSHQLSIFITELTKGVSVKFKYPQQIKNLETQTVFSGKDKFPKIINNKSMISVDTSANEWVFPNSGIIFAY